MPTPCARSTRTASRCKAASSSASTTTTRASSTHGRPRRRAAHRHPTLLALHALPRHAALRAPARRASDPQLQLERLRHHARGDPAVADDARELYAGFKRAYRETFRLGQVLRRTAQPRFNSIVNFVGNLTYRVFVRRLYHEARYARPYSLDAPASLPSRGTTPVPTASPRSRRPRHDVRVSFVRPNLYDARSRDAMEPLVFALLRSLTPPTSRPSSTTSA